MSRVSPITAQSIQDKAHQLLEGVKSKLGRVPNMYQTLAHAPNVLDGYLNFSSSLTKGKLPGRVREQISLAVGQANECHYCLAAHSLIGKNLGLSNEQVLDSRRGHSQDPKTDALLQFALKVVDQRGKVGNEDLQDFYAAGYDDAAVVEVVASVALSIFTNYFNSVTDPDLDFPAAEELESTVTNLN